VIGIAGDRICEITHFETAIARTSACHARSTRSASGGMGVYASRR
jgi:hypothetical protein